MASRSTVGPDREGIGLHEQVGAARHAGALEHVGCVGLQGARGDAESRGRLLTLAPSRRHGAADWAVAKRG